MVTSLHCRHTAKSSCHKLMHIMHTCTHHHTAANGKLQQIYTVFQKNWTTKLMAVTLSNLNRLSKLLHC